MDVKDLLPIGSVVLLKDGEKKLMITGIKPVDVKSSGEMRYFDYDGVLYPEGYMGEKTMLLFNHEDIDNICFRGYEDDERTEFLKKVIDFYKKNEEESRNKKG